MRQLDDTIFVSGQLQPADITEAAARGVTMIVNNRPDGEQFGQPTSAALRAAAEQAGLAYRHIPVSGGVSPDQVAAMAEALGAASGPVLAFCAAGMRSTMLWALARAGEGADGDELVSKAAAAGYDLSGLRSHLG
jgi:uncharacterized protein (TIGR01244 family)